MPKPLTHEQFLEKAQKVHGGRYSYELFEYTHGYTKVPIICAEHGVFWQWGNAHLTGRGCGKCSKRALWNTITTDEFITKAEKVHGSRYDYSQVVYTRSRVDVAIICREHGPFQQRPNNHLNGKGCPDCAENGFSPTEPCHLYVFHSPLVGMTKVGIARDIPTRLRGIKYRSGICFELVYSYHFNTGKGALTAEALVLKGLRDRYETCSERFPGSTETFLNVDRVFLSRLMILSCLDTVGIKYTH